MAPLVGPSRPLSTTVPCLVWCVYRSIIVIVVVPVEYFFEAAILATVDLRGTLSLTATEETLSVGLVRRRRISATM